MCIKCLFPSVLLFLGLKTCQSCQILRSLDTSPICQDFPEIVTPFALLLRAFLRKLVIILFKVYLWNFKEIPYRVLEFWCKTVWVHWTPSFRMSTLDTSFHMILENCIYYFEQKYFEHLRIWDEILFILCTLFMFKIAFLFIFQSFWTIQFAKHCK